MKYAILDAAGQPVQWCNDDTVTVLPKGALALTDKDWEARQSTPYKPTKEEIKAQTNAAIDAQLLANDQKIMRAIVEGDTARISAHAASQASLRAKRIK